MSTLDLSNLSIAALKEAVGIKEQIDRLQSRLSQLLGGASISGGAKAAAKRAGMSAAARARIAAAQRARWAKLKGKGGGKANASNAKPAAPKAKKRPMSEEARKRLSELMKARWAARKKA